MTVDWTYFSTDLEDLFYVENETREMLSMSDSQCESQYYFCGTNYKLIINVVIEDRRDNV